MKKLTALILAMVMLLSLTACVGGDSLEPSTVIYKIGDTVTTDIIEFTLNEFNFERYYSNKDEKYAVVNCSLKNIGKTKIDNSTTVKVSNGSTVTYASSIESIMRINYNDGFLFDESTNIFGTTWDLEPLSPAQTYEAAYSVPQEIIDNTSAPLILEVFLPNNGTTEMYSYRIR